MFHRTQLLLDQADAYQKAGQWQAALELCETLFQASWREHRVGDALEALLRIGVIYSTRSLGELAGEYYHLVAEVAVLCGDKPRAARAVNGLGVLSQRSGDMEGAVAFYVRAKLLANEAGDRQTEGDAEMNLGTVANIRGDLRESLTHYQRSLAEYEKVGNQPRVARVLNNLGMLYSDLQDYEQAAASLGRALNICRLSGDLQVEGIILTNQVELFIVTGELERARSACVGAFEIASRLNNLQLKAEVLRWFGAIYRVADKPFQAESHLRQAIDLAKELQLPLIEAEASRELALTLRSEDRNREALDALMKSHSLFTQLQAKHEQAEIDERFTQLEKDFLSVVEKWGESIEAKDRYTRGHCQRVADYACRIASGTGMDARYLPWFRMGAFLHDVGKTETPEAILNKPGKLTDEERRIIEDHTVIGWEILKSIQFPWDILPMVRSHHERWDGRGYPDGLAGEDIPTSARILHIADVFDALTSTRSYRDPLTPADALELMEKDEGSFDPELLAYFASILHELQASAYVNAP